MDESSTTVGDKKIQTNQRINSKPEDWIARDRARQAAAERLLFSMCLDLKSFSSIGQKTINKENMGSSRVAFVDKDVARWLNTVPILKKEKNNHT